VAVQGGPVRHAGLGVREGVEQVGLAVAHLGKARQKNGEAGPNDKGKNREVDMVQYS
jgi:hypothetical protein